MNKVIVYSGTYCSYCKQLKSFLEEQKIPYEERNIDENPAYGEELSQLGYMSVPVTVIGEKQVLGFNPARIMKLYSPAHA